MLHNKRMNQPALFAGGVVVAGRRGSSDAHQLYGARLSCHLMRFGVTVGAAGYAQAVRRIGNTVSQVNMAKPTRYDGIYGSLFGYNGVPTRVSQIAQRQGKMPTQKSAES